jgi:hypothetical protein
VSAYLHQGARLDLSGDRLPVFAVLVQSLEEELVHTHDAPARAEGGAWGTPWRSE